MTKTSWCSQIWHEVKSIEVRYWSVIVFGMALYGFFFSEFTKMVSKMATKSLNRSDLIISALFLHNDLSGYYSRSQGGAEELAYLRELKIEQSVSMVVVQAAIPTAMNTSKPNQTKSLVWFNSKHTFLSMPICLFWLSDDFACSNAGVKFKE